MWLHALGELEKIERFLKVLPDSPAVYTEWKHLVVHHGVLGSKVYHAKLVATINVHSIFRILTFNTGDFARYDIEVIHPSSLLAYTGHDRYLERIDPLGWREDFQVCPDCKP